MTSLEESKRAKKLTLYKSHMPCAAFDPYSHTDSTALKILILYFQQNMHSDNYLCSYCVATSTDNQENYVPVESRVK